MLEFDVAGVALESGDKAMDIGGIAAGYNVAVVDRLEIISQLYADLPASDEAFGLGLMAGFIATL